MSKCVSLLNTGCKTHYHLKESCICFSIKAFENTLKSWEDKLKYDKPPLRPHLYPQHSVDLATEEEATLIQMCARAAEDLITRICEAAQNYQLLEQELAHAVNASSHAINKTHPKFPEVSNASSHQ